MKKAKDIMQKSNIIINNKTLIKEVVAIMSTKHKTSLPVVDKAGKFIGFISEEKIIASSNFNVPSLDNSEILSLATLKNNFNRKTPFQELTVRDCPLEHPDHVSEETPEYIVYEKMSHKKMPLIPVLRDEKIIGIIERKEVLKNIKKGS